MRLPRTFLLVAAVTLLFTCASAAIIGIDFGSEFIKVSSVAPGAGFHIVLDEQSKRKISTCVAFDGNERLFGNGAISLNVRRPADTYQYFQRLLGKTIDSPQVAELKAMGFPYEFVTIPERNSLGVRHYDAVNKTEIILSVEEIVAMSLQHIQHIAEVDAKGQPAKDCVITVPGYWTQKERQALLDAAEIAGWNVLSLINENTAAAIQYGLDRKYSDNETFSAVFYNMGATGTQVSLVNYYGVNKGTAKKEKIVGSFEVRGNTYDPTLGGQAFESRIVEYIVKDVEKQLHAKGINIDLHTQPKVMAKIRNAAEKAKVVLSANSDTHIVLGSLLQDLDFRLHLTREHFYSLAHDLLERVTSPLQRVIEENGLTPADVNSVVIIGGGVRVPAVQAALKKYLGRELAQNLNGDEAFTFGAVFRAANLSTAFQVRQLGMIDITNYPVGVRIQDLNQEAITNVVTDDAPVTEDEKEDAAPAAADKPFTKRASLFTKNNRLSKRKTVTLSHTRDVSCQLFHDNPKTLPYGMTGPLLHYNVTGVSDLNNQAKYTEMLKTQKPRVSLTFALDASGITTLSKAEAQLEESIKVLVPKVKPNVTTSSNSTDANSTTTTDEKKEGDATTETTPVEGEAAKNETEEPEYTYKKKTHTIPLKVSRSGAPGSIQPFKHADKIAAKARLDEFKRRDNMKKEIAEAKNALESHIYGIRNILSDEDVEAVSTEAQREAVSAALSAAEEWLYEQTTETAPLFKSKLAELKQLSDPIMFRKQEAIDRPKAIEQAKAAITETKNLVADFEKNRPWIKAEDRTELLDLVTELEKWLDEKEKAQEAVAAHDEPVLVTSAIVEKLRPVAKLTSTLLKLKKPVEKPKPKIKVRTDNSTTADNSTTPETPVEGEPIAKEGTEPIQPQDATSNQTPTETPTEAPTEAPTEPPKDEL